MGKALVVLGADFSANKIGVLPDYQSLFMGNESLWDSLSPLSMAKVSVFGIASTVKGKLVGVISYGTQDGTLRVYVNNGTTTTNKYYEGFSVKANSKDVIELATPLDVEIGDFIGVGYGNNTSTLRYAGGSTAHVVNTYTYKPDAGTIVMDGDSRAFSVAFVIELDSE